MARRDYSDVVWPWDGDPSWREPREGATSDTGDGENWRLACAECGLFFPVDVKIAAAADHYAGHFSPGDPAGEVELRLDLVWVGLGTPPQPPGGLLGRS